MSAYSRECDVSGHDFETFTSGVSVNGTSEGAEVMAVACHRGRRLIKTKRRTFPAAPVFDLPHAKNSALCERSARQSSPFEGCSTARLAF